MTDETHDESQNDEDTPEAGAPGEDAPEAAAPEGEAAAGEPAADEPAAAGDAPAEEPTAADDAPADEPTAADDAPVAAAEPAPEERPPARQPKPRPKRDRGQGDEEQPEVIPGAHLEPDLVLEEPAEERDALGGLAGAEIEAAEQALEDDGRAAEEGEPEPEPESQPTPRTVLELAADARYRATGKRKRAVARVTLKPGTGTYTVNGRELDAFFPRPTLQTIARQPLEAVGQAERMDVVAKIHGGGVSAQAGALRHGIARALVEADPNLRGELKTRGFLTRDARVKERKKAGLKKARKRPQFSKR